jgi:DDE superfamily endonuclease
MEDILDLYTRPLDPTRPLVCFDETSKQLVGEAQTPLPMTPGHPRCYDTEYERRGTATLFLFTAPLLGWREVKVTDHRTRIDFAHVIRELVDVHFPDAERITLVLDNLNIHEPASLYQAFEPAEAKRLWEKLDLHPTPKHGSWLNIAEIEFSVLSRQCLDQRIPDQATLATEVAAWVAARNADGAAVEWRFTTADARIKLRHLYPVPQPAKEN